MSSIANLVNYEADAYHIVAECFSLKNDIDSALYYDSLGLQKVKGSQYAKIENMIVVSIARKLRYKGDYLKSNEILFQQLDKLSEEEKETKAVIFGTIASNYDELKQKELPEEYYIKAIDLFKQIDKRSSVSNCYANLAGYYNHAAQFSEALEVLDSMSKYITNDREMSFYYLHKADAYGGLKNFDSAIKFIDLSLELDKKLDDVYAYAADLNVKGKLYLAQFKYEKALKIFEEANRLFVEKKIEDDVTEWQILKNYFLTFFKINNDDLSQSFTRYLNLNDSLLNQSKDKNFIELDAKYKAAEKDAKILEQRWIIEQEEAKRNRALGGVSLVVLISGFGMIWYRNSQKTKEIEAENKLLSMSHEFNQIELAYLNAQLDPHEIKNLLASISPEIQSKAPDSYNKMLQLLSLTQASLNNSITESLEIQLVQVEKYLQLINDSLFEPIEYQIQNHFHYDIQLPRLLMKNLIENSVKHGFKNKPRNGKIIISVVEFEQYVVIQVQDNGEGLKDSYSISGFKGKGISTYQKLFQILNIKNKNKANIEIINHDEGCKVTVRIPVGYDYMVR